VRYYNESLAVDPHQFRVHALLGTLALSAGNLDDAARLLQTALAENPHFTEAMANLGFIESLRVHEQAAEE
jgi:Flp pilus assembly protein TadD